MIKEEIQDEILLIDYPEDYVFVNTNFEANPWKLAENNFERAESFENEDILTKWKVHNGGTLSLTPKHYKNGQRSLQWNWDKGSRIRVFEPRHIDIATESNSGGIQGWIYNEEPIVDKVVFNFGNKIDIENNNPFYCFEFNLNYKGWRAFWVHFKEDAFNVNYIGEEARELNMMEIIAPSKLKEGSLYFDIIEFCDNVQWLRHHDYQMPAIRGTGKLGFWDCMYYSKSKPTIPLESEISERQINAFNTITKRYEEWVFGKDLDLSLEPIKIRMDSLNEYIKLGLDRYEQLKISRTSDGNITGVPLFAHRSSYGPKFRDVATKIFMPLVLDYKINNNIESKEKLMNLFDFYNDQGWAEGSSLQSLEHETLRSSGYFHAVYLMREELKETGRLERELATMKWYTKFGSIFGYENTEITADEVRTHMMYKLLYVLALDNTPTKVQYMKELHKWMNGALRIVSGYASTIKPDYTGFHHRGVYANAYAPHAYNTASVVTYLLHDTEFAMEEGSINNLKAALLTQRIISNKYDVPVAVCGRFPDKNTITHELIQAYAYLAVSTKPTDKELAEAFMSLWKPESIYLKNGLFPRSGSDLVYYDTMGGLQLMLNLANSGCEEAKEPEGHWIKPYAALAVHRRNNWMVAVKGWSQYSWDYEAGRNENSFGRYVGYGSVQILANGNPVNTISSGYNVSKGWDWKRWPGTTAINLPLEELAYDLKKDNHRYFSDETFVGGVSSRNENGLFAMVLHDTAYNNTFRARKSVFFFDNEIICLGSDIENSDNVNSTETTLFQSFIQDESRPFWLCSNSPITEVPFSVSFNNKETIWTIDPYGNGYVVKNAQGLNIERKNQSHYEQSGKKVTSGLYTTAWIDHGKAPKDAGYEYVILVQETPKRIKEYAESPSYEVLQKDGVAHIVKHKKNNTIGYAIFDERQKIKYGLIKKVSAPVIAMVKEIGIKCDKEQQIIFSLSDPDLRLEKLQNMNMPERTALCESKSQCISVELEGVWGINGEKAEDVKELNVKGGTTLIEFNCIDGKTLEISLIRH